MQKKSRRSAKSATILIIMVVGAGKVHAQSEEGKKPSKVISAGDPLCPDGISRKLQFDDESEESKEVKASGDCADFSFKWLNIQNIRLTGQAALHKEYADKVKLLKGGIRIYKLEQDGKTAQVLVEGEASAVILTTGIATVILLSETEVSIIADQGDVTIIQDGREREILIPQGEQKKLSLEHSVEETTAGCVISLQNGVAPSPLSGENWVVITSGLLFVLLVRRKSRAP